MARLQDFQTVTPTSSDKLLVVQSQGQGLVPYGSKLDSANPTGTGSLSINRKSGTTTGTNSVTLGNNCEASGALSFACGITTKASGDNGCVAEGNSTTSSGRCSHSSGLGTVANHRSQFAFGEYNVADTATSANTARGNYVEIVGNGTSSTPSNARTLDWSGNETLAGDLTINGNQSLTAFRNDAYTNPTTTGLTLKNGAENYGFTSYYYKKLGRVTVNMSIKSLSSASTVIATLPENYRPRTETTFFVGDGSATGNCSVVIATNGNMTVWKSSTQYAIGEISFDAFN